MRSAETVVAAVAARPKR
jgi:hypothetical protein